MTTNTNMCVFNKYTKITTNENTNETTKELKFKKHIIDNVFWDDSQGVNLRNGYDKNDLVNVYIPKDKNDMSGYVKPKQYNGNGWTLQNGDFIIKGLVTETEVSGIKDLAAYETFTITMVDDKDFGSKNMHHFEIRGK